MRQPFAKMFNFAWICMIRNFKMFCYEKVICKYCIDS